MQGGGGSVQRFKELQALILSLGLKDIAALIPFQQHLPPLLMSLDIVVHEQARPEPFGRSIVEANELRTALLNPPRAEALENSSRT